MLKPQKGKNINKPTKKQSVRKIFSHELFYGTHQGTLVIGTLHPISRTSGSVLISALVNLPENAGVAPNAANFAPTGADFFADIKKGNKNYFLVDVQTGNPYPIKKLDGEVKYLSGITEEFPLTDCNARTQLALQNSANSKKLTVEEISAIKSSVQAEIAKLAEHKI